MVIVSEWLAFVPSLFDAFDNLKYNDDDENETDPDSVANIKACVGGDFVESEENGDDGDDDDNATKEFV